MVIISALAALFTLAVTGTMIGLAENDRKKSRNMPLSCPEQFSNSVDKLRDMFKEEYQAPVENFSFCMLKNLQMMEQTSQKVECQVKIDEALLKCAEKNKDLTHFLKECHMLGGNTKQRLLPFPGTQKNPNLPIQPKYIPSCSLIDKYYAGDIIETPTNEESPEDCQKICQSTQSCQFFTWDRISKQCLRRSYYSLILDVNNSISGPKFCKEKGGSEFHNEHQENNENASLESKLNELNVAKPLAKPRFGPPPTFMG